MKKYFLTSKYKLLHASSGLVTALIMIALVFVFWNILVFNFLAIALLVFTIISATYWIINESIIILDEGIKYIGPDVAFEAKWRHVEKISNRWYFLTRVEGIIIDKSRVQVNKIAIGMIKRFPLWGWSQKVFIPISSFSENWRDSELGQQIKQYAPHLFE